MSAPFMVGDAIQFGDISGNVVKICFRTTHVLRKYDGRVVQIPNTLLASQVRDLAHTQTHARGRARTHTHTQRAREPLWCSAAMRLLCLTLVFSGLLLFVFVVLCVCVCVCV